jgi:hypothetical protein
MDNEEFQNWTRSLNHASLKSCKTVFDITTIRTLTTSLSSLCDGFPRAQSVGETTLTYAEPVPNTPCLTTQYTKSEDYQNWERYPAWSENHPDPPSCQVPLTECSESWSRYVNAFRDLDGVYNASFTMDVKAGKFLGLRLCDDKTANGTCVNYSVDVWKTFPFQISTWKDHLFANCPHVLPRLRAWLMKSANTPYLLDSTPLSEPEDLSEQELDRNLEGLFFCFIRVDSFVLFHFPLAIPTTRDICTNSQYGEFFSYTPLYASTDPAVSAIVTAATFGMHDLREGAASISKYSYASRTLRSLTSLSRASS